MVWPLQRSQNAEQEIAAASYPEIRYFKVALTTSDEPLDDVQGEWRVVTPETAGELSGVAYFFARHPARATEGAFRYRPISLGWNTC